MDAFILEPSQYDFLLRGLGLTLRLLLFSFLVGVAISLVVGVGRLSHREWVRGVSLAYVEFARGISSIILLFIMAIAIPIMFQLAWNIEVLAVLALGINMGGYGAEIVRGAIQAIPKGQSEASIALNLSPTQRLRYVVLPQAMKIILPPLGNLTIEILKGTALVSLIGLNDLMQATRDLRRLQLAQADAAGLTVLFTNTLVIYFVISLVLTGLFRLAERYVNSRYESRRGPVPPVPSAAGGDA